MKEEFLVKEAEGCKLYVQPEEYVDETFDPRNWDTVGKMVCFHRRYKLGDPHDFRESDYNSWKEVKAAIEKEYKPEVILPLYLYDHSGLRISTSPFSCPWDSGQVGFIFTTADGVKRLEKRTLKGLDGKERRMKLVEILVEEVEAYDTFLMGDIWQFVVYGPDGDVEDSCTGFFDYNHAVEAGEESLKHAADRAAVARMNSALNDPRVWEAWIGG